MHLQMNTCSCKMATNSGHVDNALLNREGLPTTACEEDLNVGASLPSLEIQDLPRQRRKEGLDPLEPKLIDFGIVNKRHHRLGLLQTAVPSPPTRKAHAAVQCS